MALRFNGMPRALQTGDEKMSVVAFKVGEFSYEIDDDGEEIAGQIIAQKTGMSGGRWYGSIAGYAESDQALYKVLRHFIDERVAALGDTIATLESKMDDLEREKEEASAPILGKKDSCL